MNLSSNRSSAIITGASSGIGKATALAFAQSGIDVALVSRSPDKLEAVASACRELAVEAKVYPLDLILLEKVAAGIADIARDFGDINILVNNAGMGYTNLLGKTSLADWQQVIDLNLTSVFQCIQGILPQMRVLGNGIIINVASIAARTAFPNWGAYSVSKAALAALSRSLAVEERSNGIRVTTIFPGAVDTPIWDTATVRADFDRGAMLTPDIVARSILHTVLLPPQAVVEEMIVTPSGGAL